MSEEKGYCLKCFETFKKGKYNSLCPKCLEIEFKDIENGNPSSYLYANMEYLRRKYNKAGEERLDI